MQEILNLARRLVYPAAICLLLWAAWQVLFSPYISDSSGKIIAVYDGDSTVRDCIEAEHVTPDKENISEQALAGFCAAADLAGRGGSELSTRHRAPHSDGRICVPPLRSIRLVLHGRRTYRLAVSPD